LGTLNAADDLVVAGLVNTLSDSNRNVRAESINALLRLGGASISALAALQTLVLEDPDPLVQELAASAIISIENANASPDCASAVASPNLFWPPDHKMVEVLVTGVNDPDGDSVTVALESVTQDEAVDEAGSGNSCPDAIIDGDDTAMIRSERSGRLDGRIYRLNFSAADGKGGACNGVVRVCIPHEESTVATCIEQPEEYDSTACP
jgi:HEAT repeat protein